MKTTDSLVTSAAPAPEVFDSMRSLTWLAFPFVLSACLEDEEAPTPVPVEPRIYFVSPQNGDTVGRDLRVDFGAIGFEVKPAGEVAEKSGYLTLFVDEPCLTAGEIIAPAGTRIPLTGGELHAELALDVGHHRLCVQAADGRGVALGLTSVLEIEVVETQLSIVAPGNGNATTTTFELVLEATGILLERSGVARVGAGHFYVVVDEACPEEGTSITTARSLVNLSGGESSTTLTVVRGEHTLCVGLADGADVALAPRASVRIYAFY